jgi:long-chain acyl-CoA synthetase
MMGYYKEPDMSREVFTDDGWLRTGDKGFVDAQNCLHITGRLKDLFKTSKGKYVAPAPIEDRLVMHEALEACVVTGANLSQPLGIVLLNASAVAQIGDPAAKTALQASLAAHLQAINSTLDPHEQMACLVVVATPWSVENDIITPTFKVKRDRIEDLYAAHYAGWTKSGKRIVWQTD